MMSMGTEICRAHGVRRNLLLLTATGLLALVVGCRRESASPASTPQTSPVRTAVAVPLGPVEAELQYELLKTYGSGLTKLAGIDIDSHDHIHLAGAEGIRVLDPDGNLLASWRTSAAARCVDIAEDGTVWVGLRTKVESYDDSGKLLSSWGEEGRGRGELSVVTAIAVDGTNVFVADAGNRCVHRFDLTGDFIDEIGKRDRDTGFVGILAPSPYVDLAVDGRGVLHVTNPGRLRVERYRADGRLVDFWGEAGTQPEQFCGCCNPTNIALFDDGRTVTAEKGIPRVKVYDAEGKMLAYIGPEYFSAEVAGLDLALDSAGRIHVIDPGDGNVRVFELKE